MGSSERWLQMLQACVLLRYRAICQTNCPPGGAIYDEPFAMDSEHVPRVDLYVAEFPCQPFSRAVAQKGFDSPGGSVFSGCVSYIEHAKPKCFILEKIQGLRIIGVRICVLYAQEYSAPQILRSL